MSSVDALGRGAAPDAREAIIAEFRAQLLRGEAPSPDEYAERYPEFGDSLIDLLAAIELLSERVPPEPAPPTKIGPYPIRRELARGGMGVVYEAHDPALDRTVALKVLPLHGVSESGVERFRREVQNAAQLEHPGIVRVYDSGTSTEGSTAGLHYFAMQFIDGHSLAEEIASRRGAPRDEAWTRTVIEQIASAAEALEFAHARGVLHRDIKPSNLLVDATGRTYLADFGLAKRIESEAVTASNDVVGTLRYLAPERLAGVSDPRSDLYSLGLVLYEALTLEPAIRANDRAMLLDEIANAAPIAPRQLDPQIPRELETIILTALQPWPGGRYASAGDLAADLRAFLDNRPIRARRPRPLRRGLLWARRNRALAGTIAGAVTVLVAATITYLVHLDSLLTKTRSLALSAAAAEALDRDPMLGLLLARESTRLRVDATSLSTVESALAALHETAFIDRHASEILSTKVVGDRGLSMSREKIVLWNFRGEVLETIEPGSAIVACDLDRTGTRVAFALDDGTIAVNHLDTREVTRTTLPDPASQVTFDPGTETIVSVTGKHDIVRWDLSGAPSTLISTSDPIRFLAPHPSGDGFVVGGRQGGAARYDRSGTVRWTRESTQPPSLAVWNPHGTRLAIASRHRLTILDDEGTTIRSFDAHDDAITDLAFSADGTMLATASADQHARVWSLDGTQLLDLDGHGSGIEGVRFNSAGSALITVSADQSAIVWDSGGTAIAELRGHDDSLVHGDFSPDGASVVTTAADGTVRFWQVQPPDHAVLRGHEGGVYTAVFSPDGRSILTASRDRTARLWDLAGQPIHTIEHPAYLCAAEYLPSGEEFLVTTVRLGAFRYALDGTPRGTITGPARRILCGWEHEGQLRFLARGPENEGLILDEAGGVLAELTGHESYLWSATFDPRTDALLTTADDGTARSWDPHTGEARAIFRGHDQLVRWASASPTADLVVTSSDDGTAIVWRTDGTRLTTLRGHEGPVLMATFSPSGDRILTASRDATARVWTPEGECVLELDGHEGALWAATFSPDGARIVTASFDCTARTWLADRTEILRAAKARATRDFTDREWREYGELLGKRVR